MKATTKFSLTFLLLIFFAFLSVIFKSAPPPDGVRIWFFDVGQGDATLIEKGDYQLLIDGGPDNKILSKLGEVMPLNDRKIETIILTHAHSDHLTGLNLILDRYQIGQVYLSGSDQDSLQYQKFTDKIKKEKVSTRIPKKGETMMPFEDSSLTFIWPGENYQNIAADNLNNTSLISKFCYQKECVLLTGDIEISEQEKMLDIYAVNLEVFSSSILKVPHHGSKNAVNERFYNAINPKYSIFSVGADNSYGHPSVLSLDLAKKFNSRILRTDQNKDIIFQIDQKNGLVLLNR